MEEEGWVYCISNPEMSTLVKIGMTMRTPAERLAEANRSDTWRPPVNYVIEFAKKVKNPLKKEKTIHSLLEQYNQRVNRSREFFRISVEKAKLYFELMDGDWWGEPTMLGGEDNPRNEVIIPSEAPRAAPREEQRVNNRRSPRQQRSPRQRIRRNLKPVQVSVKGLEQSDSKKLLNIAMQMKALEVKFNNIYYHYNDIVHEGLRNKLDSTMIFAANIISPDDITRVVTPRNLELSIERLKNLGPSTFILLERVEVAEPIAPLPSAPPTEQLTTLDDILKISLKNIRVKSAKELLKKAYNLKILTIKIKRKEYTHNSLNTIKPTDIQNKTFEASLIQLLNDDSEFDPDCAIFVSNVNINAVIETIEENPNSSKIVLEMPE